MTQTEPVSVESAPQMKALSSQAAGHTQKSRSLRALADDYFSVEERTLKDWFKYVYQFSQHLAFIDGQLLSQVDHWQMAIPTELQINGLSDLVNGLEVDSSIIELAQRADIALLMGFFQMMSVPKKQFDDFTHAHKQYFYRDILLFKERPEEADKAHVTVNLIDSVLSKTLQKGVQFRAGQDDNGKKRIYESTANVVLNHSQVGKVLSLSQLNSTKKLLLTQGYSQPLGLEYPDSGLLTFGEATLTDEERQTYAQLGFTLASQELYLSGGQRVITLSFNLKANASLLLDSILCCFSLRISTPDGLVDLDTKSIKELITEQSVSLEITLDEYFPAVSHYIDDAQPLLPKLPHIEFSLKGDCLDKKRALATASFERVCVKVAVNGLTGLVANHDGGAIDTSKPFEPFTYSPKVGSKFHFTHPELLTKNIINASLDYFWLGRPVALTSHYGAYLTYRKYIDSNVSSWDANALKITASDSPDSQTIEDIFSVSKPVENVDHVSIQFIESDNSSNGNIHSQDLDTSLIYDYSKLPVSNTMASQWPKWFTFTLAGNDFGHSDYAQVAQYHGLQNQSKTPANMVMVNPPYAPLTEKLIINYTSEVDLTIQSLQGSDYHELQHIHPLGRPGVESSHGKNIALLPDISEAGYLYIGVSNVTAPGQFRLYFQLEPVDGNNTSDAVTLDWCYLHKNQWTTFSRSQGGRLQSRGRIIEDSTFNLLDSGIITFEIPEMELAKNFLGDNLFWIRISIEDANASMEEVLKYSRIKSIHAQGIEVKLASGPHHSSHYAQPLEEQSINSLLIPDPQVSEVLQPYASFSAKESETAQALEVRASERIRHKNRALTCWDFEHLVLAEFPELFMARCYRNITTQLVEVVVVPINHDPKVLQPKVPLFLKRRIQRFLSEISTNDIEVRVVDPIYEELTFKVTLNIVQDYDIDSAVAHLNQLLIDYMTPWNKIASENNQSQDNSIYLTEVGMMLERHPAVDIIYSLQGKVNDTLYSQSISPSSNAVILVPVADHEITLLNQITEIFEGIGKWAIEDDFIVS